MGLQHLARERAGHRVTAVWFSVTSYYFLEAYQDLFVMSPCNMRSFSWALEKVSHGTFADFNCKNNLNQWENITCLLGCHHTGISRPQKSSLLLTILVDRHFEKFVPQSLKNKQTTKKEARVWERGKQEASKAEKNHQGGWALKSHEISSMTISYDKNS